MRKMLQLNKRLCRFTLWFLLELVQAEHIDLETWCGYMWLPTNAEVAEFIMYILYCELLFNNTQQTYISLAMKCWFVLIDALRHPRVNFQFSFNTLRSFLYLWCIFLLWKYLSYICFIVFHINKNSKIKEAPFSSNIHEYRK